MSGMRPKIQMELAFPAEILGEAQGAAWGGTEPLATDPDSQRPVGELSLLARTACERKPSNRRVRDPYARWCGRGGAARLPPIPIVRVFEIIF